MTTAQQEKRAQRPPRENVLRTATFGLVRDAADGAPGDGLTLDGYAAVFNQEEIIDSWEGRFWEKISPGSMKRSFRETPPIIQFDHGHHPLIGSIPIAELSSVAEEVHPELAPEGGAHIVGRLLDNWLIQPVRDAIAAEAINGMSFRFGVLQEKWTDPDGKPVKPEDLDRLLFESWFNNLPDDELLHRDLKQLKVPEMGPVTWPAYAGTSVSVRSKVVIDLGRLHEPEQRRLLAEAVFRADAQEHQTDEAQATTADTAAGDHAPDVDDTQRSTDDTSAGEHESTTPDLRARIQRAAAFKREYLALTLRDREVG